MTTDIDAERDRYGASVYETPGASACGLTVPPAARELSAGPV